MLSSAVIVDTSACSRSIRSGKVQVLANCWWPLQKTMPVPTDAFAMDITVVNLRTELPPFYQKLGYEEVGTAPLHEGMNVTQPAHLIKMSKLL